MATSRVIWTATSRTTGFGLLGRSRARGLAVRRPPTQSARDFEEETLREVNSKLRTDQASERAPADWDDGADDSKEKGKNDKSKEVGGPRGLEPTRFGDWERKGRCSDFS